MKFIILFVALFYLPSCATHINTKKSCETSEEVKIKGKSLLLLKTGSDFYRVDKILKKICSKYPLHVEICTPIVIDSPIISPPESNRFNIIITKGTISKVKNDNFLAFIVGHEISHIILGHNEGERDKCVIDVIKKILSYPTTMSDHLDDYGGIGKTLGDTTSPESLISALILYIVGLPVKYFVEEPIYEIYDHSKEYQADLKSINLLKKSGYDIQRIYTFWDDMENIFGKNFQIYRSSHPSYDNRKNKLQEYILSIN